MPQQCDVAIVGGGPAGLAMAIECCARGLSCVVLERAQAPVDKACGEGLMPAGLEALERLGARSLIAADECAPFTAIRYVQEDGRFVEGELPAPGGLGIRRVALADALYRRAVAVGAQVRTSCTVLGVEHEASSVTLRTGLGDVRAQLVVAADGLHSAIRKAEGLELSSRPPYRYGIRQHFALPPFGPRVEVHYQPGVEAYVTPAGCRRVGVAFLWRSDAVVGEQPSFSSLLARFPSLQAALGSAETDSKVRGAGPLFQKVKRRTADRLLLLGDAAGYVDAITGEGLSLAFEAVQALGPMLKPAIEQGASVSALSAYERAAAAAFRRYAFLAKSLVWVAGKPRLRRFIVDQLIAMPAVFGFGLRLAMAPAVAPGLARRELA